MMKRECPYCFEPYWIFHDWRVCASKEIDRKVAEVAEASQRLLQPQRSVLASLRDRRTGTK